MSISYEHIEQSIKEELNSDAEVKVLDLTGGGDHFQVEVISTKFEGKTRVARHRMIYKALDHELRGPIHALSLKTFTPHEYSTEITE